MTIRPYPMGSDYVDALQNPSVCFKSDVLKTARVELDKLRRPRPISGNFASVFALTLPPDNKKLAIKCFTKNIPDQEVRYKAISDHLASFDASWKVGFTYQKEQVLVGGRWYPLLQMDWAGGVNLISWIDRHISDVSRIAELANNFALLVASLEERGIAHGDLQHGNLLVADDSTLRLVDYDGMFVPALTNLSATEQGHRNYQAPARASEFHAKIDHFSAWVIYLSLAAIVEQPALWGQLRTANDEHLLLAEDDFKNPSGSSRFPLLFNHSSSAVRDFSNQLASFARMTTALVPKLEPFDLGSASVYPTPASPVDTPVNARAGAPAWMRSHLESTSQTPATFESRSIGALLLALTLPTVALLVGVLILTSYVSGTIAIGALGAGLIVWSASMYSVYRKRPEAKERSAAKVHIREITAREKNAVKAVKVAKQEIDAFEDGQVRRADKELKEREQAHKNNKNLIARVEQELKKQLSALESESAKIAQKRQKELNRALQDLQKAFIETRLSAASIASAKLSGFGPKLIGNLRDHGFVTAADLAGVRYVANGGRSTALLVNRAGQGIKVPNVGEVKARSLESWRLAHMEAAYRSAPTVVPSVTRSAIEARYAADDRRVASAKSDAQRETHQKKATFAQELSARLVELTSQERRANAIAATERLALRKSSEAKQRELDNVRPLLVEAKSSMSMHRATSFGNFLIFAIRG